MSDYDARSVGENIRNYRVANNLTQRELSKQIGISPSYLSAIENGILSKNGSGSLEVMCKIATALGVTLDDLAGDNLECRKYNKENSNPIINRIMLEMNSTPYSRLRLFRSIINVFIK